MKITVVFDSLEEFQKHMTTGREKVEITAQGLTASPAPILEPEEPREDAAHVSGMCPIATQEPAQEPEKEQEPVEELPFKEDPKPAPKEPRVEDVRKALAALNKKAGKNIAKELIASMGYKKLTEVPEGALVTLQSLIEEEEKNYA